MQALILAAGMGNRLGKYTEKNTKCMVRIGGRMLIEYALEALATVDLERIVIVVGYEGRKLMDFVGDSYDGIPIKYVNNEIYDKTNNIYSLWLASKLFTEDDTILLESDLIFEKDIIRHIVEDSAPDLAVVAKYESWMDGTVATIDDDQRIISFLHKNDFRWEHQQQYYKTVNIYKMSKNFINNYYLPFLNAYITTKRHNEYYEQILRIITFINNIELKAFVLKHEKWYEIDDIQDKDIAEVLFASREDVLEKYRKRYGGYWRFPELIDFCYLVNPYFPNKAMLNELKSSFEALIKGYPSGLDIQDMLAAKLFNCEREDIIVGNGAAELIQVLMGQMGGKVGLIYPTFNEYPERLDSRNIKKLFTHNTDFGYDIEMLKSFCSDIKALVLINPDNPSGHFLSESKILELAEYLNERDVSLIVDESFADFADPDERYTLIQPQYLQRFKNLIVIKSISKSYGVPGLRLGVLACGCRDTLKDIRSQIPIWNINSYAEFFLQIIGKYKKEYEKSCDLICEERRRFYIRLADIGFLKVYPSNANYFLCSLESGFTSQELAKRLLIESNIFIKDLSGKEGFPDGEYIRIAIRNKSENDLLIERLKSILA